jgi:hypothetical protein
MSLPGYVADRSLYPNPTYRNAEVRKPHAEQIIPAYGAGECYDDCMAGCHGRGCRRFARFCATACG